MPKELTVVGLIVAALLFLLFGVDLALGMPFEGRSKVMDICFIVSALGLGYISWLAFRQQP